jgi:hypothetical protein
MYIIKTNMFIFSDDDTRIIQYELIFFVKRLIYNFIFIGEQFFFMDQRN